MIPTLSNDYTEQKRPFFPEDGPKADFSGFALFDDIIDDTEVPLPGPEQKEISGDIRAAIEGWSRIVDALTLQWGEPECSRYINNLILNEADRVKRQGFSQEVMKELYCLLEVHDRILKIKTQENKPTSPGEVMSKNVWSDIKRR